MVKTFQRKMSTNQVCAYNCKAADGVLRRRNKLNEQLKKHNIIVINYGKIIMLIVRVCGHKEVTRIACMKNADKIKLKV